MFGENIKRLRTIHKISQKTLADELGFSYQSISKWENETSMPDIPTILTLAKFFGVSTDSLLGNTPKSEELSVKVEVNTVGEFSLWTDFMHMGSMGADSYYFEGRHRSAFERPQAAGPHGDCMVFGVDDGGHICLILRRTAKQQGWDYYDRTYASQACLIPVPHHEEGWTHKGQYELVIPRGGFLIAANIRDFRVKQILEFVIPRKYHDFLDSTNNRYNRYTSCSGKSLFHDVLARGELDYVSVKLYEDSVVFTKPKELADPLAADTGDFSIKSLKNKLSALEERIDEIEDFAEDFEELIEGLSELKNTFSKS